MKLVTFDDHRTGRIDGDVVVELDCRSMREYFERGGAVGETGEPVLSRNEIGSIRPWGRVRQKEPTPASGQGGAGHLRGRVDPRPSSGTSIRAACVGPAMIAPGSMPAC
jgi:hypothetical protein